jgi:hypothetical protein
VRSATRTYIKRYDRINLFYDAGAQMFYIVVTSHAGRAAAYRPTTYYIEIGNKHEATLLQVQPQNKYVNI